MIYEPQNFMMVPNKNTIKGKAAGMQSIYFWLCDHAGKKLECYPSRRTIAEEAGVDIKTVDKYLIELENLGILVKQKRKKEGTKENLSNLYSIILIPYTEEVAPKTTPRGTENTPTGGTENGSETLPILNPTHSTPTVFEDFESFALAFGWEKGEIPDADDNLHPAWFHNGKLQAAGKVASLYTNWKRTQTGPAKLPDIAQVRKVDLDDGSIVLESTLRRRAPRASQGHVSYSDKNSRKIIEILKRATNSSSVDGTNIHGSAQEILHKFKTHLTHDLGIPEADVEKDWAKHFEGLMFSLAKHKFHGTKIVSVEYINRNFNRLLKEAK